MTKIRKVLAALLAILMIFSSVSALAYAADETAGGTTVTFATKFFKEVNGSWVETRRAGPGETVKARVYLGTDYFSNSSDLLFFYDKDFFTHSYSNIFALEVNDESDFVKDNEVSGLAVTGSTLSIGDLETNGYVDSGFLANHGAFSVYLEIGTDRNVKYSLDTWLFEFTLKVADDATGEGDLFVVENTVRSTTRQTAKIDVPRGNSNGTSMDIESMAVWNPTVSVSSQPISVESTLTFVAKDATEVTGDTVFDGVIGTAVTAPTVKRDGYTFAGWTNSEGEVVEAPTEIPAEDLTLTASWVKNVTVTFDTDGGSDIDPAPYTDKTPGTALTAPTDPTKKGYTFLGWMDESGAEATIPTTFPTADVTYKAKWALNVTMNFIVDGETKQSFNGYAGQEFDASQVNEPEKVGYYFIGWSNAVPTAYPEASTDYVAQWDIKTYLVKYYIDGAYITSARVPYGERILTNVPGASAPEGYKLTGWYTDSACTVPFDETTVMGTESVTLYSKTEKQVYTSTFNAAGGKFEGNKDAVTVDTAFGERVIAPNPPVLTGYTFAGWSPDVGFMDANGGKTYYATWVANEYDVAYYVNGNPYETLKVAFGENLEVPGDPSLEGRTFEGWAASADSTDIVDPSTYVMNEDGYSFYAVFSDNTYNAIFYLTEQDKTNGNVFATVSTVYDKQIVAPEASAREGYTFAAWSPVPEKMPANDVEFVGTWTINQYTITFDEDGGTSVDDITTDYNAPVSSPETTKEGYTFVGWFEENSDEAFVFTTMPARDVSLTAHWKANEYSIEFNSMGGTTVNPISADYGTKVEEPAAPTKTGYNFAGWFEGDSTEAFVFDTMPARKVTLTAKWEAKTFTPGVKFNANGGSWDDGNYKYVPATFNAEIGVPDSEPARSGYDFLGWSKSSVATEAESLGTLNQEITETSGVEFFAVWKAETYVDGITFNADGGVFADGEPTAKVTVTYGETITAPADPTRDGYTFEGWSKEANAQTGSRNLGTLDVDLDDTALTYHAVWKAISLTVKFDANTGAYANGLSTADVSATYDQPIVSPSENPVKLGHTFKGWAKSPLATEALESLGNLTQVTAPTFYAVWEKETYIGKITFNANGGTFADGDAPKSIDITFNDPIVAPAEPTRAGYTFKGWATTSTALAGAKELGTLTTDLSDTSITYYAVWEVADGVKYTVNVYIMNTEGVYGEPETHTSSGVTGASISSKDFYTLTAGLELDSDYATEQREGTIAADGSTVLEVHIKRNSYNFTVVIDGTATDIAYYYDAIVTTPEAPPKTGYTFQGWTGDEIPAKMPAKNVRVVANYTINKHTITYKVDGVQSGEVETKDYNTPITIRDIPDKKGYTFSGWTVEIGGKAASFPSTMPDEDIVVTGSFTVDTHNASFYAEGKLYEEVETEYGKIPVLTKGNPSKTGYIFKGWTPELAEMGTEDIRYDAVFEADTVAYKVEVYIMGLDGKYGDPETTELTNTADTTATYTPADKIGFTVSEDSVLSGNTEPDGTLILKVYYERNKYNFTTVVDGEESSVSYYYGETITKPQDPPKEGYEFIEWRDESNTPYTFGTMPAKDVKVTANFRINSYTITFDSNGGTYVAPIEQNYGTAVDTPDEPTRTGYTFGGWFEENSDTAYVFSTMPARNVDLKAKWTINQYTITFETNGGTEIGAKTQDYGTVVNAPENPTKTGYTFKGWDRAVPSTMPAENITITAQWQAETYTPGIKFDANGGSWDDAAYKYVPATFDADIAEPETDPARAGYNFLGWAKTEDAKAAIDDLGKLTIDLDDATLTYYAVWAEADGVKYTVEVYTQNTDGNYALTSSISQYGKTGSSVTVEGFYTVDEGFEHNADHASAVESGTIAPDGNTVLKVYIARKTYSATFEGFDEPVQALYGAKINAPAAPAVPGSRFIKWVDANGDALDTMPIGGAAFTPVYEAITYVINYYVDGELKGNYRLSSGTEIPTTYVGYTVPEGYDFQGWFTDSAMTTALEAGATVQAANVSLYGYTTAKNVDVVFKADGGKFTNGLDEMTVTTAFDSQIVAPEDPTKDGYKFVGWNRDVGLLDTLTPAPFIATWEALEYKATFVAGSDSEEFTFKFGEEIDMPADPESEGQIFTGWYDNDGNKLVAGTKMPAKDVTYTARFTVEEPTGYTVTFYQYEESEHGPDGIENPGFIAYGDQLTDVKAGDPITLPTAPATVNLDHYTFNGWVDSEGNEYATGATMPELAAGTTELKLYPSYTRITVKLVPTTGQTTVIERNTTEGVVKEQLADKSVTDKRYTAPTATDGTADYSKWFIYGLPGSRVSSNNIKNLTYFNVVGDGKVVITPVNGTGYGTGAVVSVYDCVTGTDVLVEQFYIVYFGDLDGDARITISDRAIIQEEIGLKAWSSARRGIPYMIKAADLDADARVTIADSSLLVEVVSRTKSIDQVTGKAS